LIAWKEAYTLGLFGRPHWLKNIVSGLLVGIVALPLAMAFAIASGVKPEQGIYTAIVAGLITSLFGGSRLQISGPTGAFIVILSGITAHYGVAGLEQATVMAGVILLIMGLCRLGQVIKFIPDPVIVGFTAGIAVIIFVGQWAYFLGLHPAISGAHFHQKLVSLIEALPQVSSATAGLGLLSLATLLVSPRFTRLIPAPLIALIVATLVTPLFERWGPIATIGSTFGEVPATLPMFVVPPWDLASTLLLVGPAFTIALLGAIESLLSAVVADSMAGTRHDSNQELMGQGLANIIAPFFGGFASTGAIARTATNIRSGATSPLSGVVHAVFLVGVLLILAPLASRIPLSALAAILFVVAYNMSEYHRFIHMLQTAPRADAAVLLITFLLTVFGDLVVAVNIGVVLASLLFMKRMSETTEVSVEPWDRSKASEPRHAAAKEAHIILIEGPFFFGAAHRLQDAIAAIHGDEHPLILRFDRVPVMDATAIESLRDLVKTCQRRARRIVFSGLKPHVKSKLERDGLLLTLPPEDVIDRLSDFS
jgi:SulP family sulfate permease